MLTNADGRPLNAPDCPEPIVTLESRTIMRNMARSWVALANQMDRLGERDHVNAAHLALAR